MCTPLMQLNELPILPYDPLTCNQCAAVLNPYARVDYQSRIWICPFCYNRNSFPRSYSTIGENNIPAELFPTYSTVEYQLGKKGLTLNTNSHNWGNGRLSSSNSMSGEMSSPSLVSSFSSNSLSGLGLDSRGAGPGFVFVVDACSVDEELRVLKNELLHIVADLPDNCLVGLVVFDSMVRVFDLGFSECFRVVVFHGEREISSNQVLCSVLSSVGNIC